MDKIEQEIVEDKQREVDLIESGIIRVGSMLIEELASAVEDNRMTLERIRAFYNKIGKTLNTYDKATDELESLRRYYREKYAAEDKEATANDNHQ